jgi:hypothetical protein
VPVALDPVRGMHERTSRRHTQSRGSVPPEAIRRVLVDHGIHPRASGSAATFALANQVPAPVLADPVGISTGKAAGWAKLAARDWSDYAANRAALR